MMLKMQFLYVLTAMQKFIVTTINIQEDVNFGQKNSVVIKING